MGLLGHAQRWAEVVQRENAGRSLQPSLLTISFVVLMRQVAVSPTVHYFAPGQSEPRGVVLPMGYSNPNIMEGIVIDPGFIANRLRGALMEAEQRTREAACRCDQ